MEGEVGNVDALFLEASEKTGGHVEASGGGGGGSEFMRPDGLVAFGVGGGGIAMEVGWEGDSAIVFNNGCEGARAFDDGSAVAEELFDDDSVGRGSAMMAGKNGELVASVKFAAIHDSVKVGLVFFEDNKFTRAMVGELCKEAGGHNASVV